MRAVKEIEIYNERERERGDYILPLYQFHFLSLSLSLFHSISIVRPSDPVKVDDILQSKQSTHIFQDRLATYRLQSITMTTLRSHSVEICNCKTAQ